MLLPAFEKFIIASTNGRRLTASGKRLTKGSVEQYKCVYKLLSEFENNHLIPIRIRLIHRSSLRELQKEKLYWKRFFREFTIFMYVKKGCYDHYVTLVYKIIKTFFNYLINDKTLPIGNFHRQFRLPAEKITPIVLEPHQLKFLIKNEEFHDSLPKNFQRSKDTFVFGCTVGLRVCDLMNLKKDNVQFSNSGNFISLSTVKTSTDVKIPIPDYILKIISRYEKGRSKYLLPRLSNTNLNIHIKKIIERAGWTHNLIKIRHKQGKAVEQKNRKGDCYRFCDHITSHTMRRTAITTLLMLGVSENIVRKISGHASGSKEFYKYVAVAQDYLNGEVMTAFDKLLSD